MYGDKSYNTLVGLESISRTWSGARLPPERGNSDPHILGTYVLMS